MTNETKPVLLTEAEWRAKITEWGGESFAGHFLCDLRSCGLIAPEPVDALLIEAGKICEAHYNELGCPDTAEEYQGGGRYFNANDDEMSLAMRALRRGMELAKPELTREMVREALKANRWIFQPPADEALFDRLHAALTKGEA